MKELLLLRHGKSDWTAPYGEDHERPLATRGRRDAKRIGRFVSQVGVMPELILTSSAERAQLTTELAVASGDWSSAVIVRDELYGASARLLEEVVRSQPDNIERLMLVGHNPGWETAVSGFVGGGTFRFPTAALAFIRFHSSTWRRASFGSGTLIWLVVPKLLKKAF